MMHYRCRCGKNTSFGSMPPPRCRGCDECGTNLASSPDLHHDPEPHNYQPTSVETDEGTKTLTRCTHCFKSRKELEGQ